MKPFPLTDENLIKFVSYNMQFAPFVTGLASRVAMSQIMVDGWDISAEIASYVFDAARDEYHDRDAPAAVRTTHRSMAQAVLRVLGVESDKGLGVGWWSRIHNGYSHPVVGFALGFHLRAEEVAGGEFSAVMHRIMEERPDLQAALEAHKLPNGVQSAWSWFKVHASDGGAEEDHASSARKAVELLYRRESHGDRDFVEYGISQFDRMNREFWDSLK